MKYWYDLIYSPSWVLDENGLKDGEDVMIFVVLTHNILKFMGV